MRTKSQIYADVAFPRVREANDSVEINARKYKTLCKKAGSLVRNSGLMQTLAFFKARGQRTGEEHHLILLDHLEREMCELGLIGREDNLYETTKTAELPQYMVLTREALRLFNWHKRLCETLIITPDQEGN